MAATSNPKACLELGFVYHLRLNKGKGALGLSAGEASYEKVTKKSMVNMDCIVRFIMQI